VSFKVNAMCLRSCKGSNEGGITDSDDPVSLNRNSFGDTIALVNGDDCAVNQDQVG
jgi:hypothetical protein